MSVRSLVKRLGLSLLILGPHAAVASRACNGDPLQGSVRSAFQAALEAHPAISAADADADYGTYIERALERTFEGLSGPHTCKLYGSGADRFSVHAFAIAEGPKRDAVVARIEQRKARTLKIEQPLVYTFIPTDTALVFLVTDLSSAEAFRSMFEAVTARAPVQ